MSADAPAPAAEPASVAEEPKFADGTIKMSNDPIFGKPRMGRPKKLIFSAKKNGWIAANGDQRTRLAESPYVLGIHREEKAFNIDDFRKRMQAKVEDVAELAIDDLRARLTNPVKAAQIPTSTVLKVLKYIDTRNVEIAKRMKEEGLEKNNAPQETHQHLTLIFNKSEDELKAMSEPERELYMRMRLAATSALPGASGG